MRQENLKNKRIFLSLCVSFLLRFFSCLFLSFCSFVYSSNISRLTSSVSRLPGLCLLSSLFLLLSFPNNAHANRLFTSGFELQSLTAGVEFASLYGSPTINTTIKRTGAASMRSTASGDFLNHQVTSATGSELYFRFYFYVTSYPSSNGTSIFAVADLNLDGVWLLMNTNGVLELWNADNDVLTTQIGSDSSALSLNTWYKLEIYLNSFGTTWKASARVNGATFTSSSSIAAAGSSNGMTIWPGIYGSAATVYYDDIAINNVSGSFQNSWPGDGGVVALTPNAAGDSNCTTGNYTMVGEIPISNTATSGSTMCELDTNATTAYFNVTDSSTAGIGSSDYVALVYELARIREDTSGATNYFMGIKSAASGTVLSTTVVDAGNTTVRTNPNSTTAFGSSLIAYTDPATQAAWTPTGTNSLDNMQVGVGTTDGNPDTWALGVYVMVEYGGSAPTDTGASGHWRLDEGSNQTITDATVNAFNGVMGDNTCLAGAATCPSWTSGRYGSALSFDGGDYVNLDDVDAFDSLQALTLSVWVKSNTVGAAASESHFVDKSACSGGADAGSFEMLGGGFVASKPSFLIIPAGGSPASYVNATGTTSIDDTNWHLLTGVYDGSKVYMYVDGNLEASTTLTNVTTASSSYDFEIGGNCNGHGGIFWNGLIDDVRIYRRALSAAEVRQLYDGHGMSSGMNF